MKTDIIKHRQTLKTAFANDDAVKQLYVTAIRGIRILAKGASTRFHEDGVTAPKSVSSLDSYFIEEMQGHASKLGPLLNGRSEAVPQNLVDIPLEQVASQDPSYITDKIDYILSELFRLRKDRKECYEELKKKVFFVCMRDVVLKQWNRFTAMIFLKLSC
jgi:uncharacterized protein (UPF0335 family)